MTKELSASPNVYGVAVKFSASKAMEEIEGSLQAENILPGPSESGHSLSARDVRAFYKTRGQNGNKLAHQANGDQIRDEPKEDPFYPLT